MQQASGDKAHADMQTSGKFIDTLIVQWMKRTGSNISLHQTEEQQTFENPSTQDANKQRSPQNQEHHDDHLTIIQGLKRKLRESQEAEASLSACVEMELRNKEEIQTKLNATWESIETITEYFNYISESLASFQQHRANLSSLYDNVILKQQETVQKLQPNSAKMKDLENQVARLRDKSVHLEERLQEAAVEEDKLRRQLKNTAYELQSQKKESANTHAQEKLKLVKEQQRLLQEYESRLQTCEKEKCDAAKLVAQLEDKLQIQEEKTQKALTEQNDLRKQAEDTEREFSSQRDATASAHAEEKRTLVDTHQRLLSEYKSLQSQLKMLEQNKSDTAEMIAQKDALLSKLQDENSAYKNQIEVMMTNNNEIYRKCETFVEQQDMCEKELNAKSERIQNLEALLNAIKQRESNLINDVNRIEKELINETNYSRKLESRALNAEKELKCAQEQNDEMQRTVEKMRTTNELDSIELQQQLKTIQREKEEVMMRESTRIRNTEILYENMQAKYNKEIVALKSNHEVQLTELKKTINQLNETANDIRNENSVLNMTLVEVRADNSNLRNNYELLVERNELQGRLREATEALQMRSIENRKQLKVKLVKEEQKQSTAQSRSQARKNAKRKHGIRFDPNITEISEIGHCNVSTSADVDDDEDNKQSSSQAMIRAYSIERESQKEQETEITSMGKKFFKSRPVQPRTYYKRRQNL